MSKYDVFPSFPSFPPFAFFLLLTLVLIGIVLLIKNHILRTLQPLHQDYREAATRRRMLQAEGEGRDTRNAHTPIGVVGHRARMTHVIEQLDAELSAIDKHYSAPSALSDGLQPGASCWAEAALQLPSHIPSQIPSQIDGNNVRSWIVSSPLSSRLIHHPAESESKYLTAPAENSASAPPVVTPMLFHHQHTADGELSALSALSVADSTMLGNRRFVDGEFWPISSADSTMFGNRRFDEEELSALSMATPVIVHTRCASRTALSAAVGIASIFRSRIMGLSVLDPTPPDPTTTPDLNTAHPTISHDGVGGDVSGIEEIFSDGSSRIHTAQALAQAQAQAQDQDRVEQVHRRHRRRRQTYSQRQTQK
eukprot:TRINITY_DN29_c0_g1_i1.p1 TRINITY_DN29_c0_g1~~TRINITY_DN29_c0_g1_i1.p1  ORF type:complete len:366 (-),score=51.38 TRINITY_DN29_c0_g1_i1:479-1576(-)